MDKVLQSIEIYNSSYKLDKKPALIIDIENDISCFIRSDALAENIDNETTNDIYIPLTSNSITLQNSSISIDNHYDIIEITITSDIKYTRSIVFKYKLNDKIETNSLDKLILLNKINGEVQVIDRIPRSVDDTDNLANTSIYPLDNYNNIKILRLIASNIVGNNEIRIKVDLNNPNIN